MYLQLAVMPSLRSWSSHPSLLARLWPCRRRKPLTTEVISLSLGDAVLITNCQRHINDIYHEHFICNWSEVCVTRPHWLSINTGSGPSGNNPEQFTWANIDTDFCHHMASLGPNEFKQWLNDYIQSKFKAVQLLLIWDPMTLMWHNCHATCS